MKRINMSVITTCAEKENCINTLGTNIVFISPLWKSKIHFKLPSVNDVSWYDWKACIFKPMWYQIMQWGQNTD